MTLAELKVALVKTTGVIYVTDGPPVDLWRRLTIYMYDPSYSQRLLIYRAISGSGVENVPIIRFVFPDGTGGRLWEDVPPPVVKRKLLASGTL